MNSLLGAAQMIVNQRPGGRRSGLISQASETPRALPICLPVVCFIFGSTSLVLGWDGVRKKRPKKKKEAGRDESEEEEGME